MDPVKQKNLTRIIATCLLLFPSLLLVGFVYMVIRAVLPWPWVADAYLWSIVIVAKITTIWELLAGYEKPLQE